MNFKTIKIADIKADGDKNLISGYASHFNNKDSHEDIITKGAFKKTITENKKRIKVLWQHDKNEPIGIPIEMYEDEKGLFTVSKISETETGKKALILARDNVLNEMSIGFVPIKEKYDNSIKANIISEIKLYEYSLVTFASNPLANVTDIKEMFDHYSYSKGNILDIIANELYKSLKTLQEKNEPSTDTQIIKKSYDDSELEYLLTQIKKMKE